MACGGLFFGQDRIVETLSHLNLVRLEIRIKDGGLDGEHEELEGIPDIRGLLSSWLGFGLAIKLGSLYSQRRVAAPRRGRR